MVITIDGPTGSGKSTTARLLAKSLGIFYFNTGLLYRAVAYIFSTSGIDISKQFSKKDIMLLNDINYVYEASIPKIYYRNKDITGYLSNFKIEQNASIVSANKEIREVLLSIQRVLATKYSIVADGRDCGTVVFPDADFKFYLTASVETRAKRMLEDTTRGGSNRTLEEVKKSLLERDERDMNREVAPLRVPKGAIVIDNSFMTIEQTMNEMMKYIK